MQFSLFTSGSKLSKTFSLGQKGELVETPGGRMAKGRVEVVEVEFLEQMRYLIAGLNGTNALSFGIPVGLKEAVILSEDNAGKVEGAISRTRKNFAWPEGPGIFMCDYDAPKDGGERMSVDQLLAALNKTCPALSTAPTLVGHSASTYLYNGDDQLKGPCGIRVYYAVKDATDIPRAGEVLFKRLWLAGYGRIEISKAPSMLVKSPVDRSVWGPEKLDFAGGASCVPPITQKRPAPILLNDDFDTEPLDTKTALPDLTKEEEARFVSLVAEAKDRAQPALDTAIEAKVDATLAAEGKTRDTDPDAAEAVRSRLRQSGAPLTLDTELIHHSGTVITIRECLKNPETWDREYFRDPYDPEYGGNNHRIAQLHLDDPINIFSFAHGGTTYYLEMRPEDEFEPVPLKEEIAAQPTGEPTADLVPVEYVINGFLSCGVLYLGGGHGVGKSTFLAPITALVTGELPRQFEGLCVTLNRRVIYFAEDPDQMKRCRHALVKYHGMTENREVFHIRRAERRTPAQVATLLKALMAEHTITGPNGYQIKPLVVFDTTNANFEIENENDSQMVGKFIASMKENAPGAPVWVIGHVAKALLRADLEELTGRGSGAWEADAQQTAFIFADEKVDKDARFLGVKKCRFEPEYREVKLKTETAKEIISTPWDEDQTIVLRHGVPTRCSKAERERAKEEAKLEKAAAAVNDASQVIRNILNGCAAPVSRNRVLTEAQAMGLKQKTAREAVDLLIEDGEARDDGAYMAGNVQRRDGIYLVNGERF